MEINTVLVAGGINVDTTLLVGRLPLEGETILSTGRSEALGGKALNQAVALSRAGANAAILGTIGNDEAGRQAEAFLRQEGINTTCMSRVEHAPTGTAYILLDKVARNAIVVSPGANMQSDKALVERVVKKWSNVRAILANGEFEAELVIKLFAAARRDGKLTVWNPSPLPEDPEPILSLVDILVLNDNEARALAPGLAGHRARIENLLNRGPYEVALTLGKDGCLLATDKEIQSLPANAVGAIDPTAAGDTFLGYYLASRIEKSPLIEAAALASVAASSAVQLKGAARSIPKRATIESVSIRRLAKNACRLTDGN